MPLLTDWHSSNGVPGYRALAERLRLLVLEGRLPVGTVLPSERSLAQALETSRTTTTSAYRLLRETGFAVGTQGAGTWTSLPSGPGPGNSSADGGNSSGGGNRDLAAAIWPILSDGEPGPAGGRGDFASAATVAPPELHAAYQVALAEMPRYLAGTGYVTAGLMSLRARIAERYTARGLPTVPEQILVTNGALQAVHLILEVLAERGDRVLVEHPTYPAAADAIRQRGCRPIPLPVEDGWDLERARALIRQTGTQLAYLMVDFHNPTGRLLDLEGRHRLGQVIAETGCTVIVDESLADIDLRADLRAAAPTPSAPTPSTSTPFARTAAPTVPIPRPLAAFTPADQVITIGSASKTIWGGLRVGWVRAPQHIIRRLGLARANQDLGGPLLEQLATAHLLTDLDTIVAGRRRMLAQRCLTLVDALAAKLPDWVAPLPAGGMSLWCHLPEPRSSQLVSSARVLGVRLTPGPRFGLDGAFESRLRLPFTRPESDLVAMVDQLCRAWNACGEQDLIDDDTAVTIV